MSCEMAARRDDYLDEDVPDDDDPALPSLDPSLPASPSESSTSSKPAAASVPLSPRSWDSQPVSQGRSPNDVYKQKRGSKIKLLHLGQRKESQHRVWWQ